MKTSSYSFFQRKLINSTFVQFWFRLLKQNVMSTLVGPKVLDLVVWFLNFYIKISKTVNTKSVIISEVVGFHEMVF